MPRFVVAHRRPPVLRLVGVAAVGLLGLGLVWRLAAGEPASAAASIAAIDPQPPADYVPEEGPAALSQPVDPLGAAPDVRPAGPGAPLDVLRVTSAFGFRRHPILGFSRMHQGVDFAAREGTPVLAAADGVVTDAAAEGGYGDIVRIRHAAGWATGYAHLSAFAPGVARGVGVTRGQVIGFVGHTGLATGPHLHYEVSRFGVRLDPMQTPFGGARPRDPHEGAYAAGGEGLRGPLSAETPPG
jgi:murein DD-endopeptidase MepM/ murein hydrolase activator NlpD